VPKLVLREWMNEYKAKRSLPSNLVWKGIEAGSGL